VNRKKILFLFLQAVHPSSSEIVDILACTRACDSVIFVVSCHHECMDEHGLQILLCLLAQGISSLGNNLWAVWKVTCSSRILQNWRIMVLSVTVFWNCKKLLLV